MYHEKLIKAMHERAWTKEEIKKGTAIIKKLKDKEPKSELFNYWSNIFYLFVIILVTSISLTPIILLTDKIMSTTLTILFGLIFGSLTVYSITTLEDYNDKHHRLWGNLILFIGLLIVSYSTLKIVINLFQINASALFYALIYKISFAIFPAFVIIRHEIEMNKHLAKIKRKIKRKK
jgi:FtsH-binding integral membrane protein